MRNLPEGPDKAAIALLIARIQNDPRVKEVLGTEDLSVLRHLLNGHTTGSEAGTKTERDLLLEKSMLSAFVENTPAAVAMFDTQFRYIAYSRRWLEEYKLTGRNILGLSHYEVFPSISDEWKEIHLRCLNGAVERNEEDRWRPDGWEHDQFLRWEVRPWYQYDGQTGGIMMLTQDITEMCIQREELRAAKLQAEQASLAKSEFLANMSHEIRTPLNGVIGFTDLILKTELSPTQQQYLSIVNQSANTLLHLISDILDFSKIEAGKLELDIERCDLHELVSEAADVLAFQAQSKGLKMTVSMTEHTPKHIWTDPIRLKQILINLLGNAVKFTEKGEIEMKIEAKPAELPHHHNFRFAIKDTGIGIKKEKQHKIFDVFLQEDASTTKKYGGTGLGLSISNKLLGLMGSQLQLSSTPGEGSTFYFSLLLQTAQDTPPEQPEQPDMNERTESTESNTEHFSVLIAEDNGVNMLLLKTIIKRIAPYATIEEAVNGEECFQKCIENLPDIIFMDILMPEINGYEATKMIRATFPETHIPIIALTASNAIGEKERCLAAGMDDYLTKPVVMESIAYVIDTWVHKMKVHLNIDIVKDIVGDNEARLKEFFSIARKEISNSFTKLQEHFEHQDMKGIQYSAHKLSGTAVSAGLVQLSRIAVKLEEMQAFDAATISSYLKKMKEEMITGFELMDKVSREGTE